MDNNKNERGLANKGEKGMGSTRGRGDKRLTKNGDTDIDDGYERVLLVSEEEEYASILPPASEIEIYERLHPGTIERLLKLAENDAADKREEVALRREEAVHRRAEEDREQETARKGQFMGQTFAFIAILASLTATVMCAYLQQSLAAVAAVIVGCVSLAAVFIPRKD